MGFKQWRAGVLLLGVGGGVGGWRWRGTTGNLLPLPPSSSSPPPLSSSPLPILQPFLSLFPCIRSQPPSPSHPFLIHHEPHSPCSQFLPFTIYPSSTFLFPFPLPLHPSWASPWGQCSWDSDTAPCNAIAVKTHCGTRLRYFLFGPLIFV